MGYEFFICSRKDDKEILDLMEANPMGGSKRLTFTARPSYFDSLKIFKEEPFIIGVRNEGDKLIGFTSISIQERFLNGKIIRVGYLSNLRVDEKYRGKGLVSKGFSYLKKIRNKISVDFFISSIGTNNRIAINVLTKKRGDYPFFTPIGEITTKLLRLDKPLFRNLDKDYVVSFLSGSYMNEALAFLKNNNKKKNFYPNYNSLTNLALKPENFITVKKNNEIVGLCGCWDQTSFKQAIISDYNFPLSLVAGLAQNLPVLKRGLYFPQRGQVLPIIYLSHLVIQDNNPDVFAEIIIFLTEQGPKNKLYTVGLHNLDPLSGTLKKFSGMTYKTEFYIVSWEDNQELAKQLEKEIFYPEVALL